MTDSGVTGRHRPIRHAPIEIDKEGHLKVELARIDRFKFSLPMIRVNNTIEPGLFYGLLRDCRPEQPIAVGQRGNKIFVSFSPVHWHFEFHATFTLSDGSWRGAGSLELNAMRLFAAVASQRNIYQNPAIEPCDLERDPPIAALETLDRKDNFITDIQQGWANALHWPNLCQRYVDAIAVLFQSIFQVKEGAGEIDDEDPLIDLLPLAEWIFREVEVCHEFNNDDAMSRVADLSQITLGLSRQHKEVNYGRRSDRLQEVEKDADMLSVRLPLTDVIDLAVYAKAATRIRVEVRYKKNVLKSCRLVQSNFRSSPRMIEDILGEVCRDGTSRMTKALASYRQRQPINSPGIAPLTRALMLLATACADCPSLIHEFTTALIQSHGVAASSHPTRQGIIEALVRKKVLEKSNIKRRSNIPHYTLTAFYLGSFAALKRADFLTASK